MMLYRPEGRFAIEPEFLTVDPPPRVLIPRASNSPSLSSIGTHSSRYPDSEKTGHIQGQNRTGCYSQGDTSSPSDCSGPEVQNLSRSIPVEQVAASVRSSNKTNLYNYMLVPAPKLSNGQSPVQTLDGNMSAKSDNEPKKKPKIDYASVLSRRATPNLGSASSRATVSSWDLRDLPRDKPDRKSNNRISFEDLITSRHNSPYRCNQSQDSSEDRKSDVCDSSLSRQSEPSSLDDYFMSKRRSFTVAPKTLSSLPVSSGNLETHEKSKRRQTSLDDLRIIPITSGSTQTRQAIRPEGPIVSSCERTPDFQLGVLSLSSWAKQPKPVLPTLTSTQQSYSTLFKAKLSRDPNKIFDWTSSPSAEPSFAPPELPARERDPPRNFGSRFRSLTDLQYSEGLDQMPTKPLPSQYHSSKELRPVIPLDSTGSVKRTHMTNETSTRGTAQTPGVLPLSRNSCTESLSRTHPIDSLKMNLEVSTMVASQAQQNISPPLPSVATVAEGLIFSDSSKCQQSLEEGEGKTKLEEISDNIGSAENSTLTSIERQSGQSLLRNRNTGKGSPELAAVSTDRHPDSMVIAGAQSNADDEWIRPAGSITSPSTSNNSPLEDGKTERFQPGAVSLYPPMNPLKPQRSNLPQEYSKSGTTASHMSGPTNPFGSDEEVSDTVVRRKSQTLDRCEEKLSHQSTVPLSRSAITYSKLLCPFVDASDSDQKDDLDNLLPVSVAPSRSSALRCDELTIRRNSYPEENNPFGTQYHGIDTDLLTTSTSYNSRNEPRSDVNTPVGTLPRKFGGMGLASAWPTAMVKSSPETYDKSLNPFTEPESESLTSVASSSIISTASVSAPDSASKPPVPPRSINNKNRKKKQAPLPPVLSDPRKAVTEATTIFVEGNSTGNSGLSTVSLKMEPSVESSVKKRTGVQRLKKSEDVMKSEAPVCGGDAPKAEDKLKKLSLSVPKRDKDGGDYTEHSDISEIDLNLLHSLSALPPLLQESGDKKHSKGIETPTIPKQESPAETPTMEEPTGNRLLQKNLQVSSNKETAAGAEKGKELLTPKNLKTTSNDRSSFEVASVPEPQKKISHKQQRKRAPSIPSKKNTRIVTSVPDKSSGDSKAMDDKKSKKSSSSKHHDPESTYVPCKSKLPSAEHPTLAFSSLLIGTSEVLDTENESDCDLWEDVSTTSCSDLDHCDELEKSREQTNLQRESSQQPGQHRSRIEIDFIPSELDAALPDPISFTTGDRHVSLYPSVNTREVTAPPSTTKGSSPAKQSAKTFVRRKPKRYPTQQRRAARPVIIKYVYQTATSQYIYKPNASEGSTLSKTEFSGPDLSEVNNVTNGVLVTKRECIVKISQRKDALSTEGQLAGINDFWKAITADHHDTEYVNLTQKAQAESTLRDVDTEALNKVNPKHYDDVTKHKAVNDEVSFNSPFVIVPSVVPTPNFDFQVDLAMDSTMETVEPIEQFQNQWNDLPHIDINWDEYASTSGSSPFMSEKDILEKIEDAQMDMRRKQRALSIIPEYPEDESEEEKGHKIVLTTNLDDELPPKYDSDKDCELSITTFPLQGQQNTERQDVVSFNGTVFHLQDISEESEHFQVHHVVYPTDADESFDTIDEGCFYGKKEQLSSGISSKSNKNITDVKDESLQTTDTAESQPFTVLANSATKNPPSRVKLNENCFFKELCSTRTDVFIEDRADNRSSSVVEQITTNENYEGSPMLNPATNTLKKKNNELEDKAQTKDNEPPHDESEGCIGQAGPEKVDIEIPAVKAEDTTDKEPAISTETSSGRASPTAAAARETPSNDMDTKPFLRADSPPHITPTWPAQENKIEILDNSFEDDDQGDDITGKLNKLLLQEFARRRQNEKPGIPETSGTCDLDTDSFFPSGTGSLRDLDFRTSDPEVDSKPKAKALPLPPVNLISRRYSAGDEMAYRNMASSRDSATVQSRINSTSVLQSEIVTNKTVAAAEKQAPGKNAVKTPQDTTQQSADKWRVWPTDLITPPSSTPPCTGSIKGPTQQPVGIVPVALQRPAAEGPPQLATRLTPSRPAPLRPVPPTPIPPTSLKTVINQQTTAGSAEIADASTEIAPREPLKRFSPIRPAPSPPLAPELNRILASSTIPSEASIKQGDHTESFKDDQIAQRFNKFVFPSILPPLSNMNSERRRSSCVKSPSPIVEVRSKDGSRAPNSSPASNTSTRSDSPVFSLHQSAQVKETTAGVTLTLCPLAEQSVRVSSPSAEGASGQSLERQVVDGSQNAGEGLTYQQGRPENEPSYEEDMRRRRKTVSEDEMECILRRTLDFGVGEDRLSHQTRNIEERQACLSAEARIVERQIWESTKDSPINGDYPRVVLDPSVGKYYMANEANAKMFRGDLIADLYRILNVKNQLRDKYSQLKFLQCYNELQRNQTDIEVRLRKLACTPNGRTATLSFEDYNYERALVNRLVEVVTQRDRLVEMMDEQNKRKKALAHTSQSLSDLGSDSFGLLPMKSSKSSGSPDRTNHGKGKIRKKRHGVKHFLKKQYSSLIKRTGFAHSGNSWDRIDLTTQQTEGEASDSCTE